MGDIEQALKESMLFVDFSDQELHRVAQVCELKHIDEKGEIFREGEEGDALFTVMSGKIRIFRILSESYDETMDILGPGGIFGEMSFVDRVPRSTSATALEPSSVVVLSRSDFDETLKEHTRLASQVMKRLGSVIAERIRATNAKSSEAEKWVQTIQDLSEWTAGLERAPEKAGAIEIAIKGHGTSRGRLLAVSRNPVGSHAVWEDETKTVHWTPYHGLHYFRILKGSAGSGGEKGD